MHGDVRSSSLVTADLLQRLKPLDAGRGVAFGKFPQLLDIVAVHSSLSA